MAKKYDVDAIRDLYQKQCSVNQGERYAYERDWYRNILYMLGVQWITYAPTGRTWRARKMPKWVPRPVTNKFAAIAASIIQVLSQREPSVSARAATDEPADLAAAMVADRALPVILQEAGDEEARNMAAAWLALTGTVVLHPCYDNDPIYGTTFAQKSKCGICGAIFPPEEVPIGGKCLECGKYTDPAIDETGNPIGDDLPNGRVKIEVFSPFETFLDLEGRQQSEIQRITVRRRYPIDVIRRRFDNPDIQPDNSSNTGGMLGLNLLRAIAYAATSGGGGLGYAAGRSGDDDQYVTVDCFWNRPCTDYPEGLVAYFANDTLINEDTVSDGIPYRDREGNPLWPWHIIQFDQVPGRTFGRTPLDDVAPKQEQRNKLESLMQLIVTRCASPQWLVPKNLGISEITGDPGQQIEYNWTMDRQSKPERISGENIPSSLMAWLEKIDSDMNEVSGVFEVLKGNAPAGVTAGTALRLLLERALTRYTPVARRYEKGWEACVRDLLAIFQQYAIDERVMKIAGPGNTWEIERFSRADIRGSIDVVVEQGSSLPKSQVGEQALITDLVNMQLIDPTNPETQYKILERFGSTSLLGDTDSNIRAAQRENWDLENEDEPPELDLLIDLHQVHLNIHKQLALKSDFKRWPEEKKQLLRQHILEHMMAAAPPQPPGPMDSAMMAGAGPMGAEPTDGMGGPQKPGQSAAAAGPDQGEPGMPPDLTQAPPAGGVM